MMQLESISISKKFAEELLEHLCELRGERNWWKDEPRLKYQERYETLCNHISTLTSLLNDE